MPSSAPPKPITEPRMKVVRTGSIVETRWFCNVSPCRPERGAKPVKAMPTASANARCYNCNRKIQS